MARSQALGSEPRILDRLPRDLRRRGLVGEERLAKIVYLATTSRLLKKIVSIAVKGPSSAGKSFTVETVLGFFPDSAFYALTAMSDRALAYSEEPVKHRMLVIYEAAGIEGDWASLLVRTLLSEGRIRYETVEKVGDEIKGRMIEREGPTGLITTTTRIKLHPENETRLLSLVATDTPEQTSNVLLALADEEERHVDVSEWHDLQRWLELGQREVTIPFGQQLAKLIPPKAVRLRRDFAALLALIRAHALLHQASRRHDERERIVATIEDYAVVRDLVATSLVRASRRPSRRRPARLWRRFGSFSRGRTTSPSRRSPSDSGLTRARPPGVSSMPSTAAISATWRSGRVARRG